MAMIEALTWSKDSIVNVDKDIINNQTGTASVTDKSLTLDGVSTVTYSYTYDTTNKTLKTSNLKFYLDVINQDITINSRYDESVQVEVHIQYYKENISDTGVMLGYVLGGTDTIQVNPYYRHEDMPNSGYIKEIEVETNNQFISLIEVNFINTSTNQVIFVDPKIYHSMSVADALENFEFDNNDGVVTYNDLILYTTDGSWEISNTDEQKYIEVVIPEEYCKQVSDAFGFLFLDWLFTDIDGNPIIDTVHTQQKIVYPSGTYTVNNGRCQINPKGNGIKKIRAELTGLNQVYDEKHLTITNNNVTDIALRINNASGKIDGNGVIDAYLEVIPVTNKTGVSSSHQDIKIVSLESYDGVGLADYTNFTGQLLNGRVNIGFIGKQNGKVKLIVEVNVLNSPSYQRLNPVGFRKEFIIDVVNVVPKPDFYLVYYNGTEIDANTPYLRIGVKTDLPNNIGATQSQYTFQALDAGADVAIQPETTVEGKELIYRIYPLGIGKVQLKFTPYYWIPNRWHAQNPLITEIEVKEVTTVISTTLTSNTGIFEINNPTGQLEVEATSNYTYHNGYVWSQRTIDGGSVTLAANGNIVTITANKEGKLELVCKPNSGPEAVKEIVVSNQYPVGVNLHTGTEPAKVLLNSQITVYAEPTTPCATSYDKYNFIINKVTDTANTQINVTNAKYLTFTGNGLGTVRIDCTRQVDNKFMGSIEIEIVDTI